MNFVNKKNILSYILYFSIFALLFAFYVEFVLGHQPCNLCLLERIPYILSIVIIIISLIFTKLEKITFIILGVIFFLATLLSIYHVGIEQGIFSESLLCELGINTNIQNTDELLKTLKKTPISCKDVTFKFLGLSLATINLITSLLICFTSGYIIKNEKNK